MHQPFGSGNAPFTVERIIELYTVPEGNYTFLLYGKELLVENEENRQGTYSGYLSECLE